MPILHAGERVRPTVLLCCATLAACARGGGEGSPTGTAGNPSGGSLPGLPGIVERLRIFPSIDLITLSWDPPRDNGTPVTGYVVEDDAGSSNSIPDPAVTVTGFTVPGGIRRCYQVYALSRAGRGPPAPQPQCAKAYRSEVAPPRNVRAVPIPRGARVTWDPPLPNDGPPVGS